VGALLVATSVASQEVTTDVYPSEDELAAAADRGDLTVADFVRLQELLQLGFDLSDDPLWESVAVVELPDGQSESKNRAPVTGRRLVIRHRYSQRSRDGGAARYRSSVRFGDGAWQGGIRLHREYSGAERFRSRWLEYRSDDGVLRRLRLGSVVARFGLGTVIGYPGKQLEASEHVDAESFVFPDFGGYNGLLAKWRKRDIGGKALLSYHRDHQYAIATGGVEITTYTGELATGLLLSQTRLEDRVTGRAVKLHRLGANVSIDNEMNEFLAEMSVDPDRTDGSAIVVEGTIRGNNSSLQLAVWDYGDDFIDMTAGSRAVSMPQSYALEEVDFGYSSSRTGQTGGRVRVSTEVAAGWESDLAAAVGARSRNEFEAQLIAGLTRKIGTGSELRFYHQVRRRAYGSGEESIRRISRVELRIVRNRWWWRCYAAYRSVTSEPDFAAWFWRGGVELSTGRSLEWWVHLSELRVDAMKLNRYYMYGRFVQSLFAHWVGAIKISHSYARASSPSHTTQVQFELEVGV